jgi:hypothetical protein
MDGHGIWESFIPGTEPDPDNPPPRSVLGQGNFSLPGHAVEKPVSDVGLMAPDEDNAIDDSVPNNTPDNSIVPPLQPARPNPSSQTQPAPSFSGTGGVY